MSRSRALVLGGSGHLGSAVLRRLAARGLPCAFTWLRSEDQAQALARELGARPVRVDLTRPAELREALAGLCAEWGAPDVLVHCAGSAPVTKLAAIGDDEWDAVHRLNVRAAFLACRALLPGFTAAGADVVFALALDGTQAVSAPAHFAASQSALLGLARALARELGPSGIRVNAVKVGVLEGGISAKLEPRLRDDYLRFSALRRLGTVDEAARAIVWTALDASYLNGAVVPVTGGL